MKKKVYLVVLIIVILALLLLSILTGIFSDFIYKSTGKATFFTENNSPFQSDCFDSDGMNYYEKGYRIFEGVTEWDSCLSVSFVGIQTHLAELYCYGVFSKECPNGCVDGACIDEASLENTNQQNSNTLLCSGVEVNLPEGQVRVILEQNISISYISYDEVILNIGEETTSSLVEGESYLSESGIKILILDIAYSSQSGVLSYVDLCIDTEEECIDSDGINYYIKGTRDYNGVLDEDRCIYLSDENEDYEFVKEYYCVGEENFECIKGCLDGACIEDNITPSLCIDTDRGNYPYIFGVVTVPQGEYVDVCVESDAPGKQAVIELFCEEDDYQSIEVDCLEGDICEAGECVEVSWVSCEETDDGNDPNHYGDLTSIDNLGNINEIEDLCLNVSHLIESYCADDLGYATQVYDCTSNGLSCISGQCEDQSLEGGFFQRIANFFKRIF